MRQPAPLIFSSNYFNPYNPWLVCVGLFLIFYRFLGFLRSLLGVPYIDVQAGMECFFQQPMIYITPTTLSAITFNLIMSLVAIVVLLYILHYWVERKFKIDDAVGA